jgi:chromosome segregation ATPase
MEVRRMDAAIGARDDLSSYRSPRRVLASWFRKSRDNWKEKYMDVKAEIKRFKNRAYDLQKSRDHWKEHAAAYQQQVEALQGQVEQLQAQLADEVEDGSGIKKRPTLTSPPRG